MDGATPAQDLAAAQGRGGGTWGQVRMHKGQRKLSAARAVERGSCSFLSQLQSVVVHRRPQRQEHADAPRDRAPAPPDPEPRRRRRRRCPCTAGKPCARATRRPGCQGACRGARGRRKRRHAAAAHELALGTGDGTQWRRGRAEGQRHARKRAERPRRIGGRGGGRRGPGAARLSHGGPHCSPLRGSARWAHLQVPGPPRRRVSGGPLQQRAAAARGLLRQRAAGVGACAERYGHAGGRGWVLAAASAPGCVARTTRPARAHGSRLPSGPAARPIRPRIRRSGLSQRCRDGAGLLSRTAGPPGLWATSRILGVLAAPRRRTWRGTRRRAWRRRPVWTRALA